jgi:hypothetical protein
MPLKILGLCVSIFLSNGSPLQYIKQQRQLAEKDIIDIIFAKRDKTRDNAFWTEISASSFHRFFILYLHEH